MKYRELWKSAVLEEQSRRKHNRTSMVLMALAMLIFVGVNSIVTSMNRNLQNLLIKPQARLISYSVYEEEIEDACDMLNKNLQEQEMVTDIFVTSNWFPANLIQSENWSGKECVPVDLYAYANGFHPYVFQEEIETVKQGQVIIPKYLYGMGKFDDYTYYDGDNLVGKEILVSLGTKTGSSEEMVRSLVVIGTYDNVRASSGTQFLISGQDMVSFDTEIETPTEEKIEEMQRLFGEEVKGDIDVGFGGDYRAYWLDNMKINYRICVEIHPDYDIQEALEKINPIMKQRGIEELVLNESMIMYLKFIQLLGNLIAAFLLALAFVNILIATISEMQERRYEFALKQAMGYTKGSIFQILCLEKCLTFGKAVLFAVVSIGVFDLAANYVIQNFFAFYNRMDTLSYSPWILFLAFGAACLAVLIGMLGAVPMLHKIKPAEVLKREV